MKFVAAIVILIFAVTVRAGDFESDFAIVMIDDETEARLGAFPYDRVLIANAIRACDEAKAKAVVLKFFFDLPKSESGDTALREAIDAIPVALQATLQTAEATSRSIPPRFAFGSQKLTVAAEGSSGWIPLDNLMTNAAAVGFVDFETTEIPLVEEYKGVPYKSLILCSLELVVGVPARTGPNDRIFVGSGYLPVDPRNVYRADLSQLEALQPISFARLVAGEVESEAIAGRVVVIGYDSSRTPTVQTVHGKMGIHRFFVQCLAASYRTLKANQSGKTTPAR